jgi:hypothetical protein
VEGESRRHFRTRQFLLRLPASTSQKLPALALLGRFLCLRSKLDDLPALFRGNPFCAFPKLVRHVELDYFCQVIPTFSFRSPHSAYRHVVWDVGLARVELGCRPVVALLKDCFGKICLAEFRLQHLIIAPANSDHARCNKIVRRFRRTRGAGPRALSHLRRHAQRNRRLGRR